MNKQELVKVLDGIRDLPTLPTSYFKISKLLQDVNTPSQEVCRVLESDQAIASKVLRLVNSSFFGFSRRVTQMSQAVRLLGYTTIRNAVLAISVFDSFPSKTSKAFDRRAFWLHTIASAILARQLARRLKIGQEEDAFVAGILHDVGRLVLDQCLPEPFGKIVTFVQVNNVSMLEAERQVLGATHSEIGEYLLDKWRLPTALVEAVALHHTPSNIRSNPQLVSVIHIADHLSRRFQVGNGGDPLVPPIQEFVYGELGISAEELEGVVPKLQEELAASEDVMSLVKWT